MGRGFAELCKFVDCLPSELYQRHNPTMADFSFVAALKKIEMEEENEKLGGTSTDGASGGGQTMPYMSTKGGK